MQENIIIFGLFFPLLPSKFIPVLTGEQLRTVWPRPMIPVSTFNTAGTHMGEIPLSFPLLHMALLWYSSHLAQAIEALLTCPACLSLLGLPVGYELTSPALFVIHTLP